MEPNGILKKIWKTVESTLDLSLIYFLVLGAIIILLSVPNPDSPLNYEAGKLLKQDPNKYVQTVMEWIRKYAQESK